MNAIEVLVEAHKNAQRTAIEARRTLLSAEEAVRRAEQTITEAEAAVEFIAQVLRNAPMPADNTGMETLQRAAVAVRNLITSDPEHNAWADWVPLYLDRLSQEES